MTALVDKREARIRTMFGNIAPTYDFLNHLLSLNIDHYWRRKTTQLVPPTSDAPILDVCTGTGDLAFAYAKASQYRAPIIGTDFCREMLVPARVKARPFQRARPSFQIQFLEADTQQLPFEENQFQITTVAFGLRNVTDTDKGIAEMVRVTQPGGRIAILEFSRPKHRLLGRMYHFYFRHVLPRIGQLISRSKDNAYLYLPQSVMEFPDGDALAERLRNHGLGHVRYYPLTFGIATLYVGEKVPRDSATSHTN